MGEQSAAKIPLHERALDEFKELLVLTAYLYVCLGALMLQKTAVLQDAGISFDMWGIALVKSLLLAKFMLVGRALHIGQHRFRNEALIWPTLYQSVLTLLLLLVLDTAEELLVGLIHKRALVDSLAHVAGPTPLQVAASCLIMLLILIPYFAFQNLGEVLGGRTLVRLFLADRRTPVAPPGQI
ncbi:hypothetical protein [Rhodopila globiformis]|uniref:Uncharacterized protein n=1 Tax=Rhodopila globiformis TaxID=1071 RepID=A0A2S6NLY9_RHOGL|nr:hypothetical protein [Rhodopila globiformis]PPQ36644.1 hypothetical protein CCS01_04585 [Rhodopila globiformis]